MARRPPRPLQRLRRADRRVARHLRAGPSIELARALAARAEALIELDEDAIAFAQLDELVDLLSDLEDARAPRLHAAALGRRARLSLRHEDRHPRARADAERAIEVLEASGLTEPESRELLAELLVLLGRLLALQGDDEAKLPLERAVEIAATLAEPSRRLYLARAHRELAVARAQEEPEAGLAELDLAEAALRGAPPEIVPDAEVHMTASTRAEVLANAGRVDEALALLAGRPPDEEWALAQRAATLDMVDRDEEAIEAGGRLIERLTERLDPRDPDACHELADALLSQARRPVSDDDRAALAGRAAGALEEFNRLPARSLRLLCQALEVQAAALDPAEAHDALRRRAHILTDLIRDLEAEIDRVELVRTWLQDGDVLLRLGQAHVARRSYTWAVETLEGWDDQDHPAVLGLLPLARSALGHALAAGDQWLEARHRLDAAVAAISPQLSPAGLANMSEIHLFRAIACVNTGDPEAAVEHLAKDATPLLDAALREPKGSEPASTLIEAVVNMHVLRAEVLVDHLDRVDDAVAAYDEAVALAELARDSEHVRISILGAKAAMLTERDRAGEALPLLQRCVDLMREGAKNGRGGELAQALVSLAASQNGVGQPRLALGTIQQADALLATNNGDGHAHEDEADEDEEDEDDDGEGDDAQRQAIRGQLLHQRGAALTGVGHPLLAVDEFTRSIDICRALLEEDGESRYDASQQLPLALLLRARAWLGAGEHEEEAVSDLREARVLYRRLFEDEARPAYGRRLEEVRALQRSLRRDEK